MLVMPTILTAIPLVPQMYLATFSFTVKPWASAHFFVSRVMATPMCRPSSGLVSGLTPRLITPHDLAGCNTDGEIWLIPLLSLDFGGLRPQLGSLELAHRHIYLLDDKGIGHPKQGMHSRLAAGVCSADCSAMTSAVIMYRALSSTFLALDTMMAFWAAVRHIVYLLFLILHYLPSALDPLASWLG